MLPSLVNKHIHKIYNSDRPILPSCVIGLALVRDALRRQRY